MDVTRYIGFRNVGFRLNREKRKQCERDSLRCVNCTFLLPDMYSSHLEADPALAPIISRLLCCYRSALICSVSSLLLLFTWEAWESSAEGNVSMDTLSR